MVSRPWTIHHIHSVANEQYFLLPLLSLLGKRRGAKHELQGRRKLPILGGQVVMGGHNLWSSVEVWIS